MENVAVSKCLQHIFALALTVFEIYKFQYFSSKVGQGDFFANTTFDGRCRNLEISPIYFFALALTVSDIKHFQNSRTRY